MGGQRDDQHRVGAARAARVGVEVLGEDQHLGVARLVEADGGEGLQRGVLAPDPVQGAQQRLEALAAGESAGVVAGLVLVLLVVDLLLRAGPGDVLDQLVAGVDAPGRHERGGEDRAQHEGAPPAGAHVRGEDVVRGGPEARAHVGRRLDQLLEVLLQLLGALAPGEVGVGLVVADLAQGVHHRRPGERLGQEDHLGMLLGELRQQLLPETDRLGMRVVDAEEGHAVGDPVLEHVADRGVEPLVVRVEAEGVDVLVLLRRVLGVGDGAVRPHHEPLGVLLHPRVVGGALQGDVHRHLEAELLRPGDEGVEVLDRAEIGVDRVVAARGRADRVRGAGVARLRLQGVVAPLAEGGADGVDRGQVGDVEAHLCDPVQGAGGGAQRAGGPAVLGVEVRALGAGEELVPGAVQGAAALHLEAEGAGDGDALAQRPLGEDAAQVGGERRGDPGGDRQAGGAQRLERGGDHRPVGGRSRALGDLGEHTLEHEHALVAGQLRVDAGGDLHLGHMGPGVVRGGEGLDAEGPGAQLVGPDRGLPQVQTRVRRAQPPTGLDPGGGDQHQLHAHRVMALAEGVGAHRDGLALDASGGEPSAVDDGLHVHDRDAADPGVQPRAESGLGHGLSCLSAPWSQGALRRSR